MMQKNLHLKLNNISILFPNKGLVNINSTAQSYLNKKYLRLSKHYINNNLWKYESEASKSVNSHLEAFYKRFPGLRPN